MTPDLANLIQSLTFSDTAVLKAILQALLQSLGSSDAETVKAFGPFVIAFITILFSFLGTLLLLRVQWKQNQFVNQATARQFTLLKSKEERDDIIKKLNSFYGPFKQMRTQSRILYSKFALEIRPQHEKKYPTRFRTLRYLLEGKPLGDQDREILIQILAIGKKTLKLMESDSGLVDKPELQDLLGKLGAHINILQLAFDRKLTGPAGDFEDIVFPSAIDGAIESATLRLQDRLKELMESEATDSASASIRVPSNSTIEYYNTNAEAYANETLMFDLSDSYKRFRVYLSPGDKLLDAGCGAGRDVRYFIEEGYVVIAFDASREMVRKCNEYPHAYCKQLSFDEIQFREEFDGVWACASLLHLDRPDAKLAVARLTTALKPGGIIFLSLKTGEGHEDISGRHFEYYDETSVKELYAQDPRVEFVEQWRSTSTALNGNGREWLNVILRRKRANRRPVPAQTPSRLLPAPVTVVSKPKPFALVLGLTLSAIAVAIGYLRKSSTN